ncbi:MAG: stage III sporulation protein AD [Peptococcaceae bacterium]|nr:MAG: stage III sporulation protein AD [Peptococcaceae bacterium]
MEILQIAGIGLVATVLVVIVRQQKPEMALLLSIGVGITLFLLVLGKVIGVIDVLRDLSIQAGISIIYLGVILKIIGIAYIADFGAQICRDAGEGAVAAKIEFAAKVLILVLAVPILVALLQSLLGLLP